MNELLNPKEKEKPPIKAVIFDFDGLLVDSEGSWSKARGKMLQKYNRTYTLEEKRQLMGRDYKETVLWMIANYNLPISPEEYIEEEQEILRKLYERVCLMPGVLNFMNQLDERFILKAVASSNTRSRVESTLRRLNINNFKAIVSGDDVQKGKPHPEIFLTTASLLGLSPNSCVVLEDSPLGIMAANAAGMYVVAVVDERFTDTKDFDDESKPNLIVGSLDELTIERLKELAKQ